MSGNGENGALVPVQMGTQGNVLTRQEFGVVQAVKQAETAASAVAAQAEAAVRARYSLALMRPRDWDVVRVRILKECERPSLAEVAVYSKPQGRKLNDATGEWEDNFIEGLSIRFAEVAMRYMGNLMPETTAIYDDEKIRIVRVALTDLEANNYFVKDIVIEKTVERSKLPKNVTPLRSRTNTGGKPVYILPATDDEVNTKESALASKALRNHVLRILPGDLQDEARKQLDKTFANKDAKDPDAGRKEIADGFAALNIMPDQLKLWLGHDLATADAAERLRLRKIYSTIKAGEASWSEIMAQREEQRAQETTAKKDAEPTAVDPTAPAKNLADLKKREKAKEQAPAEKVKTEKSDPIDKPKEPELVYPVIDMNDSARCEHHDDDGVVCEREGYKVKNVGFRCQRHMPEPTPTL
jgi:hypothetical protein